MKAAWATKLGWADCLGFGVWRCAAAGVLLLSWAAALCAHTVGLSDSPVSEAPPARVSAEPLPNLLPYQPAGWSDELVVAKVTGTTSDSSMLLPTDGLYVDWAVLNNGGVSTSARFHVQLFVDDVLRATWYADPPLAPNYYVYIVDYFIGTLPVGTHRIRLKADSASAVPEGDEADNEYSKTIVVRSATPSIRVEPLTLTFSNSTVAEVSTLSPGSPLKETIELQTGTLQLRPGLSLDPQAPSTAPTPNPSRHVLLQFAREASAEERDNLRQRGVTLLRSMGGTVYWASLSGPATATLASVREAGGIRSATRSGLVDKLSPAARTDTFGPHARLGSSHVVVEVLFHSDVPSAVAEASVTRAAGRLERWNSLHTALVSIQVDRLDSLASADEVEWVQPAPGPRKEVNKVAAEHGHVTELRSAPYNLTGAGVRVGVWDGGSVGTHPDFGSRLSLKNASAAVANHATHVAGTIGGSGAGDVTAMGMAPEVSIDSYDWDDDAFEMRDSVSASVRLSNHSYGYLAGWEWDGSQWVDYGASSFGLYGASSADWDDIVFDTGLIVFKAAGNDRNDGPDVPTGPRRDGPYDCIDESGCGKNIITVGATTDADGMTSFSSWGPVNDGRVKPDLCANGDSLRSTLPGGAYGWMSGTSMATPAASGAGALLFQLHRQLFASDLRADLCKAVLIHGASDLGRAGPDYEYGWGLIHARASADLLIGRKFRTGIAANGSLESYRFTVPVSTPGLKATVAWTDPAASPLALNALVNDLDVYLVSPNGSIVRPWVLDPLNPSTPATTGRNTRDNVEQVFVSNPLAGEWTLHIQGASVPLGPQAFALVCDLLPATGGQNEFAVYNDGGADLNVTAITVDEPASFLSWSPAAPFTVAPGASRTVTVLSAMTNAPAGTTTRRLILNSNDTTKNPYPGGVHLRIENPKPVVTLEAQDAAARETSLTPDACTFLFRRTGSLAAPLTVGFTVSGSASAGEDYLPVPLSITFAAGASTATLTIVPIDDEHVEPAETVRVNISPSADYELGLRPSAEASIEDDDVCCREKLVTSTIPGTARRDYPGYVGFALKVGALPIEVHKLGRMMMPGNTGTHRLKLVRGSDGSDVAGATTTLGMTGGIAGQFKYAPLPSPVVLEPRTTYYLVSQEFAGGDTWQDVNAQITSTSAAAVLGGIYGNVSGPWYSFGGSGRCYGPLDLKYTISARPVTFQISTRNLSTTATIHVTPLDNAGLGAGEAPFARTFHQGTTVSLSAPEKVNDMAFSQWQVDGTNLSSEPTITTAADADHAFTAVYLPACVAPWIAPLTLGAPRNNYEGYVGLRLEVGAAPLRVTHLGRLKLAGNTGSHHVKLVLAGTGADVPGASTIVSVSAGAPGTFVYAPLDSPITLEPRTAYHLVTRERYGGDQWCDVGSTFEWTPEASVLGGVYGKGSSPWATYGGPGTGYGPVALKYDGGCAPRILSVAAVGTTTPITVTVSPADTLNRSDGPTPLERTYAYDSEVSLGAPQTIGASTFVSWISNGTNASTTTNVTVRMTSDRSLTAIYRSGDESSFVTNTITGKLRSDFGGFVGMRVLVGSQEITVTRLGRYTAPGNRGTHRLKIVDAATGQDLPGAYVVLDSSSATAGKYQYGPLQIPATLRAGSVYYVASQESPGGDAWYDVDTTVFTKSIASVEGGVYSSGTGTWLTSGARGRCYVPLDFMYSIPPTPAQPFIISHTAGRLRSDYPGFVGMKIQVGSTPIEVLDLGRIVVAGNTGTHVVKVVSAATGQDVVGASAIISTAGVTPGTFAYASLPLPVNLEAGAAYHVVSREYSGGDSWYDGDAIVNSTGAAQVLTGAYGNGSGVWSTYGAAGRSYGPVNFRYRLKNPVPLKLVTRRDSPLLEPLRIFVHRGSDSAVQLLLEKPAARTLRLESSFDLSTWQVVREVDCDLVELNLEETQTAPQHFFRLVPTR